MSNQVVQFDSTDGKACITLNRPQKRNALSRQLLQELLAALKSVAADSQNRVLILDALGPVFCAGMDLAEMQQTAQNPNPESVWRADAQLYRDVLVELFTLPLPTVAVVQGPALAGGAGIVFACDLVLAAEDASFSLPEPRRGITASIVTPLLTYRAGVGVASSLLLSGEPFSTQSAQQAGLCHDVLPADQLSTRCDQLTASILTGSQQALAKTKSDLIAIAGVAVVSGLDAAIEASAAARKTTDAREGLAAFLEKRKPLWAQ